MKFITTLILMALLSFSLSIFLPWWSIAIACFLVALCIPQKNWVSFISGFLSLFLLWYGLSFWMSFQNGHLLANRISTLILKQENSFLLVLITALIGGIVGGFAALSGSLIRKNFKNA
jgi:hypothetical protein